MARPRKQRLPEMEDAKIEALQSAALDYADIRDQRQGLTKQEVELKSKLMDLMHAHKKTEYHYEGVSVQLVHEKETVKVKIKKSSDSDEESEPQPD